MKPLLTILWWVVRFILFLVFAIIQAFFDGLGFTFRVLKEKCQPR